MKNIVSIDPSMNGVTAIIVADYNYNNEEPVLIKDFALVDFRDNGQTDPELLKETRYIQLEEVISFILKHNPSAVILENFIMFRQQLGEFGQSFITSEMIGAIDLEMRRNNIPVVKPRSSDVRGARKVDGSRDFKPGLTKNDLMSRGILGKGAKNSTAIMVNGEKHILQDYKIGSKNDHLLMCIRHLINEMEYKTPDLPSRVDNIRKKRNTKC